MSGFCRTVPNRVTSISRVGGTKKKYVFFSFLDYDKRTLFETSMSRASGADVRQRILDRFKKPPFTTKKLRPLFRVNISHCRFRSADGADHDANTKRKPKARKQVPLDVCTDRPCISLDDILGQLDETMRILRA